ncbi:MAG: NADH-quinone oxidoreductase subunit L [Byssovorax sp.]
MSEFSGQVTHVELALTPLWLIPLFPFLGAATNAIFGRRLQASDFGKSTSKSLHIGSLGVSMVAVGAMLCAFVLALANFAKLVSLDPADRYLYTHAWQMVRIGSLDINFSFAMDPLSGLMTLIITGVGSLIHIYATSYMETEPAFWRFFTYLNLFVFSMLLLVLGDNFIVMFFGWEGVGLCSYLLIGFWYKDYKKASAGMKAFVVNRVGDWGFICGLSLLFWGLGGSWISQDRYHSMFQARFIPVAVEKLADEAEEGEEHGQPGEKGHEEKGKGHEEKGEKGEHGSLGSVLEGTAHAEEHAAAGPKRGEHETDKLAKKAQGKGLLTFTSHPGAKVYVDVGVSDPAQLLGTKLPEGTMVFTSPFIRQELPAGPHNLLIVPGDGAIVAGDHGEAATLAMDQVASVEHVMLEDKEEVQLTTVGPTVTFRELHDQLVVKDGSGTAFLKEALRGRQVWGGLTLIFLACILFFVGATGKSAQIPLYVWLPDAMAGPTPVSALIHAATMVTAGVYMIARLNFLFSLSPMASGIVAFVGASTALFAATIGFFQYDIKKVLAYSTVSQLGFMFIGVGVGAYWAGVFHLMTHAFFKACLFLGSGSVIHGMHAVEHDEVAVQDMRNMGGLKKQMPTTALTYFVACLAITAAPIPFFAGFWSKDEILWKAFTTEGTGPIPGVLIYLMGLTAALCTSFYMWRSYYLTFTGPHAKKEIPKKVHESPGAIIYVLMVLAFLSTVSGVIFGLSKHIIGGHGEPLLEEWLHPVLAHNSSKFGERPLSLELFLMVVSVGGALGSWAIARKRYGENRSPSWEQEEKKLPGFTLTQNKYYVDEIYAATVVKGFMALRLVFAEMDRWIVDGLVNGLSVAARAASWVTGAIDTYIVDGAVNFVAQGTLNAGDKLRTLQTGRIQNYVYGLLGGVAFFSILQYFLK